MRILGIDYGDARTGLSISDPSGFLAGSPSVIHEWNYAKLLDKLVAFIQENKIEEIVLGHPKNMDGTVGPRAEKCETRLSCRAIWILSAASDFRFTYLSYLYSIFRHLFPAGAVCFSNNFFL